MGVLKRKARHDGRGFSMGSRHPHRKPSARVGARETMLDSDFWRDLAEQFRAIDTHPVLNAQWHESRAVGGKLPNFIYWDYADPPHKIRSVQLEFEAIARRGGPKINPEMGSLFGWLQALRDFETPPETFEVEVETNLEGKAASVRYDGRIMDVRQSSIDFCKRMESQALEIERIERRRNELAASLEHHQPLPADPTSAAKPAEPDITTREARLQKFISGKSSVAAVRRAAMVHKSNMQQWRRGELPNSSVMSQRIEDVLSGKTPIGSLGKNKG
jgi:hypothetical protein